MRTGSEAERAIRDAARAILASATLDEPALRTAPIVAIGWATVELDRAVRELGAALGGALHAVPDLREEGLGASVRRAEPFGPTPVLLLLEPDTEGRLAAILARHGEGVVMIQVETGGQVRTLSVTSGRDAPARRAGGGRRPSAAG